MSTNLEPPMCQLANPVSEWGRGRPPPPEGVGKDSPGMVSTQRRPQLGRRERAYHPGGKNFLPDKWHAVGQGRSDHGSIPYRCQYAKE